MARMVRKQVYITSEQDRLLKRQAKALGKSEADVVRQGIELASRSKASPPFNHPARRFVPGVQPYGRGGPRRTPRRGPAPSPVWDAMILSCRQVEPGVAFVLAEDMQHGRFPEGGRVQSPLSPNLISQGGSDG